MKIGEKYTSERYTYEVTDIKPGWVEMMRSTHGSEKLTMCNLQQGKLIKDLKSGKKQLI